MSALLSAAFAAFVVELAKASGHDIGVRIVAALGPHLTPEAAGRMWAALVAACQEAIKGNGQALPIFWGAPEWGGRYPEWSIPQAAPGNNPTL